MINNVSSTRIVVASNHTQDTASIVSPWNTTATKEQIIIQSASIQNQERAQQVKNIKISNYFKKNTEDKDQQPSNLAQQITQKDKLLHKQKQNMQSQHLNRHRQHQYASASNQRRRLVSAQTDQLRGIPGGRSHAFQHPLNQSYQQSSYSKIGKMRSSNEYIAASSNQIPSSGGNVSSVGVAGKLSFKKNTFNNQVKHQSHKYSTQLSSQGHNSMSTSQNYQTSQHKPSSQLFMKNKFKNQQASSIQNHSFLPNDSSANHYINNIIVPSTQNQSTLSGSVTYNQNQPCNTAYQQPKQNASIYTTSQMYQNSVMEETLDCVQQLPLRSILNTDKRNLRKEMISSQKAISIMNSFNQSVKNSQEAGALHKNSDLGILSRKNLGQEIQGFSKDKLISNGEDSNVMIDIQNDKTVNKLSLAESKEKLQGNQSVSPNQTNYECQSPSDIKKRQQPSYMVNPLNAQSSKSLQHLSKQQETKQWKKFLKFMKKHPQEMMEVLSSPGEVQYTSQKQQLLKPQSNGRNFQSVNMISQSTHTQNHALPQHSTSSIIKSPNQLGNSQTLDQAVKDQHLNQPQSSFNKENKTTVSGSQMQFNNHKGSQIEMSSSVHGGGDVTKNHLVTINNNANARIRENQTTVDGVTTDFQTLGSKQNYYSQSNQQATIQNMLHPQKSFHDIYQQQEDDLFSQTNQSQKQLVGLTKNSMRLMGNSINCPNQQQLPLARARSSMQQSRQVKFNSNYQPKNQIYRTNHQSYKDQNLSKEISRKMSNHSSKVNYPYSKQNSKEREKFNRILISQTAAAQTHKGSSNQIKESLLPTNNQSVNTTQNEQVAQSSVGQKQNQLQKDSLMLAMNETNSKPSVFNYDNNNESLSHGYQNSSSKQVSQVQLQQMVQGGQLQHQSRPVTDLHRESSKNYSPSNVQGVFLKSPVSGMANGVTRQSQNNVKHSTHKNKDRKLDTILDCTEQSPSKIIQQRDLINKAQGSKSSRRKLKSASIYNQNARKLVDVHQRQRRKQGQQNKVSNQNIYNNTQNPKRLKQRKQDSILSNNMAAVSGLDDNSSYKYYPQNFTKMNSSSVSLLQPIQQISSIANTQQVQTNARASSGTKNFTIRLDQMTTDSRINSSFQIQQQLEKRRASGNSQSQYKPRVYSSSQQKQQQLQQSKFRDSQLGSSIGKQQEKQNRLDTSISSLQKISKTNFSYAQPLKTSMKFQNSKSIPSSRKSQLSEKVCFQVRFLNKVKEQDSTAKNKQSQSTFSLASALCNKLNVNQEKWSSKIRRGVPLFENYSDPRYSIDKARSIDWSTSLIRNYFKLGKTDFNFHQDPRCLNQSEIDYCINLLKLCPQDFEEDDKLDQMFNKAMNTLEKITEELMLTYFFQQLVNNIQEVNQKNTLKVLVRCNVLLYHREHLLSIFQLIEDREVILKTLKMPLRSDKMVSDTKDRTQWQAIRTDKENEIKSKVTKLKFLTEQVIMSIVDLIRDKRIFGNVFIFKGMNYLKVAQKEMIQVEKIMVMFGVKMNQSNQQSNGYGTSNYQNKPQGYNNTITNQSGGSQGSPHQTMNSNNLSQRQSQYNTLGQQNAMNATPIKEVGEDEEENQFLQQSNTNQGRSSLVPSNTLLKQGSNSCSQIRNTNTHNHMYLQQQQQQQQQMLQQNQMLQDGSQSMTQQTLDIEKINKEVQNEEIKNLYNATAQYDNPLSETVDNISAKQYEQEKHYNYTQKVQNQRLKASEYENNSAQNIGNRSTGSHQLDIDLAQLNQQNKEQLKNQRGILQIKRHSENVSSNKNLNNKVQSNANYNQNKQIPLQYQSTVQQVSESMFDDHNLQQDSLEEDC